MLLDNQWYGTMFPRIPAKHLQDIRKHIAKTCGGQPGQQSGMQAKGNNGANNRSDRSRSPPGKKKRRDPRDLDDRPSSSNQFVLLQKIHIFFQIFESFFFYFFLF